MCVNLLLQAALVVVASADNSSGFTALEVVDSNNDFATYISLLVKIENQKDKTRKHDIALIRMELNTRKEIFNSIANEVARNNPENTVFIHASLNEILAYRVRDASIFIVTTDVTNEVSFLFSINMCTFFPC